MFDWRDFFPVDALAPMIGGVLLWFGLNYIYLGPSVIAPRLAAIYYQPACVAAVQQGRAAFVEQSRTDDADFANRLNNAVSEMRHEAANASRNALGGLLGSAYGDEGRRFVSKHGDTLLGYGGGTVNAVIAKQKQEVQADYERKKRQTIADMRKTQKYADAPSFCGCNVAAGLSDRFDLALFTSTVRLFKPSGIADLEAGKIFPACGSAPVA